MAKVIQMVKINEENTLFITGFDQSTEELTFRVAYDPRQLHKEKIAIVGANVQTRLYFFSVIFLQKFIKSNLI